MLVAAGLAFGLYRDSTQRAARTKAQVDKVERDVLNHRANAVEELQKRLEQMRAQREACERARNTEASVDAKAKTGR